MLVVKRKQEQVVVIGEPPDEVRVKVVELSVDDWGKPQLRLGIDAPRHIRVDREEVRELREQAAAAAEDP